VLLGALWVIVLDRKIRHGPDLPPEGPGQGDVRDAAGALISHRGAMTADPDV